MTVLLADYLLNALWQAPLLLAAARLLSFVVRRLGPRAEHRLWVVTLFAQVVLPACSAPALLPAVRAMLRTLLHPGAGETGNVTVSLGDAQPLVTSGIDPRLLHATLLLYAVVIAFTCVRFAWQSSRLRSLRKRAVPLTLSGENAGFLHHCLRRLSIPQVELACVSGVASPVTFGTLNPLLLLPTGFTQRVSTPQLHAALAHELAHVHRRDFAKHLLYRLVALPLCLHPAVWRSLHRIAETREQVCDGLAAALTGSSPAYAESLLELASLLAALRPVPTHAIGIFDANHLERRILMLHHVTRPASRTLRIGIVAGTLALAAVTCTSALALRFNLDTPSSPTPQEETNAKRVKIAPGIAAGQVLNKVQPKYPAEAKKAKISGAVLLRAIIGKDGTIQNLSVISGPEELRASAIDAVRQWTYKPYLLNGQPTEVETTITVNYSFSE